MKNALKSKKVYIIGGILGLIGVGVPFGILGITLIPSLNVSPFSSYPYLLGAFCFLYLLAGFVWGDLKDANYRRKNKKWDDKLDDETKTMIWKRRLPFYLGAIITAIPFIVVNIIWAINGSIPLV